MFRKLLATLVFLGMCSTAWATTTVTKTFEYSGGDYAHLNDCVGYFTSTYPNFVTSDINGVCVSNNSWAAADTTAVTVSGITKNSTHTLTIITTGNARHSGTYSTTAYRLEVSGSALYIPSPSVIVDGIQVGVTSGTAIDCSYGGDAYIKNNIIKITTAGTGIKANYYGNVNAWNNIIYGVAGANGYGIDYAHDAANGSILNNSVYVSASASGAAIIVGGDSPPYKPLVENNIGINYNGTGDFVYRNANTVSNYNVSSDTTATGANSLINQSASSLFTSISGGSENLLLKVGSAAIDVGVDLSGSFTTDIKGNARPYGLNWDIGANESVAASTPSNPSFLNNVRLNNASVK